MRTLIQKELREQLKVGLLGLAILTLMLASTFKTSLQPALQGMDGAIAAWGSFKSGGNYRGAPHAGKLSLTISMTAGSVVVIGFAVMLIAKLVQGLITAGNAPQERRFDYSIGKDGTIGKVFNLGNGHWEVTDLDGRLLIATNSAHPTTLFAVNEWLAPTAGIAAGFGAKSHPKGRYFDASRFMDVWAQNPEIRTRWYFSYRMRRFLGYDLKTRRFLGSLGPKGFAVSAAGSNDLFDPPSDSRRIITAGNIVYLPNFEKGAISVFFTLPEGENAIGSSDISWNGWRSWDHLGLVTEHSVYLLTPRGELEWKEPFAPGPAGYSRVQISMLESTNEYALWSSPFDPAKAELADTVPTHVIWFKAGKGVNKTVDLPPIPRPARVADPTEFPTIILMPPVVTTIIAEASGQAYMWTGVKFGYVAAALCAAAGLWLSQRYKTSLATRLLWTGFHLIFGLAGLLAFVSAQEWPARERCRQCKKLRTVEQEPCEHCGAGFASPERNGTEIFEVLGTG